MHRRCAQIGRVRLGSSPRSLRSVTSPAVLTMFRDIATSLLTMLPDELSLVDEATLESAPGAIAADPVLVSTWRTVNAQTLEHWLRAVIVDPDAPVPPLATQLGADLARDLVRRGLDASALDSYRAGQNVSWQRWMERCFAETSDLDHLQELLVVSARSIFDYVDATVAAITALVESERISLTRGTHAERLAVVTLVLEGAPISVDTAGARLSHDLRRRQVAAVLWHTSDQPGQLEQAADALGRALGGRPLTVVATAASLWLWCPCEVVSAEVAARATERFGAVRVALGTPGTGLEGFRRSHLDALVTQRLLLRSPEPPRVAAFEDVQLVALLTTDEERAAEFVTRTLGALATADPVLRDTLRTYLREDTSASRAARVLFTHRNTVLGRVGRAEALLPRPLAGQGLAVALALEVVHWLGVTA